MREARSGKQEARSRKQEARSRKQEAGKKQIVPLTPPSPPRGEGEKSNCRPPKKQSPLPAAGEGRGEGGDYFCRGLFLVSCFLFLASGLSSCARDTYLTASDGVRIAYQYHEIKPERGVVLLLHGLGSDSDEWYTLNKFLNKRRWSSLAIDFRGHGLSTQREKEELDWRRFSPEGRKTMVRDIDAASDFLGPGRNVWLIGSSLGANLALNYAAARPEIRGLVLLSPGLNFGGIETRPAMKRLDARPVLLAASKDEAGAVQVCETLRAIARGPKKNLVYEKAGHGAAMLEAEENLKEEILQWLSQPTA